MRQLSTALAAALALAACGGTSKAPDNPPPLAADGSAGSAAPAEPRASEMSAADFDALMVQVVGFFGELGDGIHAVADTCAKQERPDPNAPAEEAPAPADPKAKKKPAPAPKQPPKMVTVLACTPQQCQTMATNIRATMEKNQALLTKTRAFADDEAAAQRAEGWMQDHRAQVEPALQKMAAGLRPCAESPEVIEAMNLLGNGPGGG